MAQWYSFLCNPMDCSLPASSILGILQARILEWVTIPFSRGSSRSRDWAQVSCIASRFFTTEPLRKCNFRGHQSRNRGTRCLAAGKKLRKEWRCLKENFMSFITRNVMQAFFFISWWKLQGNIHAPQVYMEWSHQTRNEMVRTVWSCMLEGESQPSPDDRGLGPSGRGRSLPVVWPRGRRCSGSAAHTGLG